MSKTVTASSQFTIDRGRAKNSAPRTKSIWSTKGKIPPGEMSNLLLTNAPAKSPSSAPKGVRTLNRIGKLLNPKTKPSAIPTMNPTLHPKKKPLKVLLFPKIRFPSAKFLPKSIFGPPPASTGVPFAQ